MAGAGFEITMIGRIRNSAPVRAALCAAALLSLIAAFGLHPEPDGGSNVPAGARFAERSSLAAPAHDCIACLKAASALASAPSVLAPASAASVAAAPRAADAPPVRPACGELPGRAPPAAASS